MTPAQELYEAIKGADKVSVQALLEAKPELVEGGGASGMHPLMLAIYMRLPEMVELLLERGATVDIFAACALGRTSRVSELAAEDPALVNGYSSDGWTPLHLASFFGRLETAEYLLQKGADVHLRSDNHLANLPLNAAAAGKHQEIVALLLAHGAPVNAQQQGGYSPLHTAAANGDEAMVRLLLAHEADTKAINEEDLTPLEMAKARGHAHIVRLLESAS